MKEDDITTLNKTKTSLAGKMDRRDFLVTTGKLVIPTLGILGLSLKFTGQAQAATCSFACSSGCSGSCGSDCSNACANNCIGGCRGKCEGVCGGCDGTCNKTCEGFMFGKSK